MHAGWKIHPTDMSAIIAQAECDHDQLGDSLRRLDVEARGAVTVVGGPVAQALDLFLSDVDEIEGRVRERASRTIEAARRVLGEYGNADEVMADHHQGAAAQQDFDASRFAARIPH